MNNLVALLSIDFHALETDVRREHQLRAKVGAAPGDSVLISNLALGPALEFERSDATRRLRLVLSELLIIMGQVRTSNEAFVSLVTETVFLDPDSNPERQNGRAGFECEPNPSASHVGAL